VLVVQTDTIGIAPPACLTLQAYEQIRETAPPPCQVASDEFSTVLTAGGIRSFDVPWHSHDCLMLLLPCCGAINFRDETRRSGTWISEERFIAVPKGHIHAGQSDNAPHVVLYLTDAMIARIEDEHGPFQHLPRKLKLSSSYAVTPEIRALRDLCRTATARDRLTKASRNHIVSALVLRLMSQIDASAALTSGGNCSHADGLVAEICAFLEAHLTNEVSLDEIAETFRFSRRHTTRLFRRCTGSTIAEYHEKLRIRAACELLSETTLPVGEIAARVGFESGSALAKATKRVLGKSPTQLRGEPISSRRPSWIMSS